MVRKTTLFFLFLISYIPLFLILAIQNLNDKLFDDKGLKLAISSIVENNLISIVLILVSILSLLYYFVFAKINSRGGFRNPKKILRIKNTGVEYLSYLATYIIPFMGVKFDTWNNLVATAFLFLLIGFIYTKTNLLYANPTLALLGYYISLATFEDGEERTVISKGKLKKNNHYKYKELSEDLFFIKTK